jgi:hypothetical protein
MINTKNRHCKHYQVHTENQAPLGSGMCWLEKFEECTHPGFDDTLQCGPMCPGFDPIDPVICPKHGIDYTGYCTQCEQEEYEHWGEKEQEHERDMEMPDDYGELDAEERLNIDMHMLHDEDTMLREAEENGTIDALLTE